MSLFQATNIIPSTFAPVGNGCVSVNDNVRIQWQVNGTSPMNGYQIDILENDVDSTLVHSTDCIYNYLSLLNFYGTDGKGNIVPFVYEPTGVKWSDWGLVDGKTYKIRLIQIGGNTSAHRFEAANSTALTQGDVYMFYDTINGKAYNFTSPVTLASGALELYLFPGNLLIINYADNLLSPTPSPLKWTYCTEGYLAQGTYIPGSVNAVNPPACIFQNYSSVFVTRTAPALTIASVPTTITDISKTFTATYTQAQSDALNWVRWILSDADTGAVYDDTGEITTGVLSYTYDGFVNGTSYVIKCMIETENGLQTYATASFDVSYENDGDTPIPLTVCIDPKDGSANIQWISFMDIPGTYSGAYPLPVYVNSLISLDAGNYVLWDSVNSSAMGFSAPYQIAWHGIISAFANSGSNPIIAINGTNFVGATKSSVDFGGTGGEGVSYPMPRDAVEMTIVLRADGASAYFYDSNGTRIASEDINEHYNIGLPSVISSVKILNNQMCDWICVTSNTDASFAYDNVITKPQWSANILLYADFNNTLQGGFSLADGTSCYIYREDMTTGTMRRVGSMNASSIALKDCGIKSKEQYRYHMYYRDSDDTWQGLAVSNTICRQFTSFYLYEAAEDADKENVYNVINVWRFGNNYNGGSVSNGNAPQFLTNFTKYPLRQASPSAAKSGTLSALLSNFNENNEYEDTAAQMEALYNLSLSENHVFLKDTKGNLYEVHTSAPITQTINTLTKAQEVTISVPWQEIADASNAVLTGIAE